MNRFGLVVLALFCVCVSAANAEEKKIVVDGSTTVGPIAKAFAEYYMSRHQGVNITVSESGSGNGAKALMNKVCDAAAMSRFMKDTEFKVSVDNGVFPVAHVVAMDGLAVIVHPGNSVANLTVKQLQDIYTGKFEDWSQLGGPKQKIVKISRETNSGTYESFETIVMQGARMAEGTEGVGSSGAVRQRVQSTPNAIGFVGLGFVDGTVKALSINGIQADASTVASGAYPISRPLYLFTNGFPKLGSDLHGFVTLYLTPQGQEIVESIGFVPVTRY